MLERKFRKLLLFYWFIQYNSVKSVHVLEWDLHIIHCILYLLEIVMRIFHCSPDIWISPKGNKFLNLAIQSKCRIVRGYAHKKKGVHQILRFISFYYLKWPKPNLFRIYAISSFSLDSELEDSPVIIVFILYYLRFLSYLSYFLFVGLNFISIY